MPSDLPTKDQSPVAGPAPQVIVLAGPNGAGKSTVAPTLLRGELTVPQFVNADTIAQGLAGFAPDTASLQAGRIMLQRLKDLAKARLDFAFETTLASRSFAPWLKGLIASGYQFHLIFLWLPNSDLAVARVADRVRMGGHDVPEDTIRRRYSAGSRNFWNLYRPMTTTWRVYNNGDSPGRGLLAVGSGCESLQVCDAGQWEQFVRETKQ